MKTQLGEADRVSARRDLSRRIIERLLRLPKLFWVPLMFACCIASFTQTPFWIELFPCWR